MVFFRRKKKSVLGFAFFSSFEFSASPPLVSGTEAWAAAHTPPRELPVAVEGALHVPLARPGMQACLWDQPPRAAEKCNSADTFFCALLF